MKFRSSLLNKLFFVSILLISFSSFCQSPYKKGKRLIASKNYSEAIEPLTKALEEKPENSKALFMRGDAYWKLKEYEKSAEDFKKLTQIKSKEKTFYLRLAECYVILNRHADVVVTLQTLPKYYKIPEALRIIAPAQIKTKDFLGAIETCNKALSLQPYHWAYFYTGVAKDSLKDYKTAFTSYQKAIDILQEAFLENKSKSPYQAYYYSMGTLLTKTGKYDDASKYFREAVVLDQEDKYEPSTAEVYYQYSKMYAGKNIFNDAIGFLNNAIGLKNDFPDAYNYRAQLYRKVGQFQSAIDDYNKILNLNKTNLSAHKGKVQCEMEIGKYPDAIADIKRAQEIYPDDVELKELFSSAEVKLYNANKEYDPPTIKLFNPQRDFGNTVYISSMQKEVRVEGEADDKSLIANVKANGKEMGFDSKLLNPHFKGKTNIDHKDTLTVTATDVYNNKATISYPIYRYDFYSKLMVDFSGTVSAVDGNGVTAVVPNMMIYLYTKNGELIKMVKTSDGGFFKFENLPFDLTYLTVLDTADARLASFKKVSILNKNGREVLASESSNKKFRFEVLPSEKNVLSLLSYYDNDITIDIKGTLVQDDSTKAPFNKMIVKIYNKKGELVATGVTNEFGTFVFKNLPPDENYLVMMDTADVRISGRKHNVLLLNEKGKVVAHFSKNNFRSFMYQVLAAEQNSLALMSEIDPWMVAMKIDETKREMTIIENIYYDYGKWDIPADASVILDKAVDVLKKNKNVTLEILSHTDSRGSDDFNLQLSEKRAQKAVDYLASKGISRSIISGKGLGETQLANHCANGVDCSEDDHKLNRRTVFKLNYSK